MAILVWDDTGTKYYETGTQKGVLYTMNADGTYANGVAWNGLTAVSERPSGAEETALYANDKKYLSLRSAEEFGATIEAYTYPDEWAECDGSKELSPNSGVYVGQQTRTSFGFSYRTTIGNDTEGDAKGYKIHIVYNAMASPSEKSYQTINDSPEAITFSWEVTTTPITMPGSLKPAAIITIDSTKLDSAKLTAIEDLLYGTASEDATLPTPARILEIIGSSSNSNTQTGTGTGTGGN